MSHHQIVGRIEQAADMDDRQRVHQRVRGKGRPAPDETDRILEDLNEAEGDEQLVFLGAAIEGSKQQRFYDDADERHRQRPQGQQEEQPARRQAQRNPPADQPRGDVGANSIEAAMREIDDPHDPEDQAETSGNEEEHRGIEQRVQDLNRQEGHPVLLRLGAYDATLDPDARSPQRSGTPKLPRTAGSRVT